MLLSVFSFRLRDLAGGEDLVDMKDLVDTEVAPQYMCTRMRMCTRAHERSTAVCVLVGEGLGSKAPQHSCFSLHAERCFM